MNAQSFLNGWPFINGGPVPDNIIILTELVYNQIN